MTSITSYFRLPLHYFWLERQIGNGPEVRKNRGVKIILINEGPCNSISEGIFTCHKVLCLEIVSHLIMKHGLLGHGLLSEQGMHTRNLLRLINKLNACKYILGHTYLYRDSFFWLFFFYTTPEWIWNKKLKMWQKCKLLTLAFTKIWHVQFRN